MYKEDMAVLLRIAASSLCDVFLINYILSRTRPAITQAFDKTECSWNIFGGVFLAADEANWHFPGERTTVDRPQAKAAVFPQGLLQCWI